MESARVLLCKLRGCAGWGSTGPPVLNAQLSESTWQGPQGCARGRSVLSVASTGCVRPHSSQATFALLPSKLPSFSPPMASVSQSSEERRVALAERPKTVFSDREFRKGIGVSPPVLTPRPITGVVQGACSEAHILSGMEIIV